MYRLVYKSWEGKLGLNLFLTIYLLVFPWKLKVAALSQVCLVLQLLLLVLHCRCSAHAQLTPKHALPLSNERSTLWWVKLYIVLF